MVKSQFTTTINNHGYINIVNQTKMDYKKAIEEIKGFFTKLETEGIEVKEEEVKEEVKLELEQIDLAVEKEPIEETPVVEEAPKADYVSLESFENYKNEVKELFSKVVEMLGQNEKNTVPKELSKEEVEATELETIQNVVRHTDEVEKEHLGTKYVNKTTGSIQDRVFNQLWNN